MKAEMFKGTGVAVVTPFTDEGKVDYAALEKLINHIIDGRINYIVALGTTSEAPVLTSDEKNAVLTRIIEVNNNRVPIVAGVGGNNTQLVADTIQSMDLTGLSGILTVAPYYNKPNQNGLYQHFKTIAMASPIPLILYNVPGRTSSNLSAETSLRLASEFDNVKAIKEASGDMSQIMDIINNKPDDFIVLSGDDALTYPMMALGAEGVISVVANAFPAEFSSMVGLCLQGKYQDARKIHYDLLEIMDALFEDGNPAGIKAALHSMGIVENNLRLPLVKASDATYGKIAGLIEKNK